MKTKIFSYLIAGTALSFAACQGSGDGTDTTNDSAAIESAPADRTGVDDNATADTASGTTSDNAGNTTLDDNSRTFVMDAASAGMMEVQLGQLAQQKATNERVKNFGAMMVRDHNKANNDLKNAVSGKATVPTSMQEKHQHHVSELTNKTGNEFDKAYMKMMVDDHQKDVDKFETMAKNANDPAIKDFANSTLPVLKMHLDSAKAIRNDLTKTNR